MSNESQDVQLKSEVKVKSRFEGSLTRMNQQAPALDQAMRTAHLVLRPQRYDGERTHDLIDQLHWEDLCAELKTATGDDRLTGVAELHDTAQNRHAAGSVPIALLWSR